ncbi:MAG TPA: DUF5995 family protein [Rhodothermales bacterium]|nr:DUF5995 family protein [Rhodothermales bacterium]
MNALIQQWEQRQDGRCIFLSCYSLMTQRMLGALETHRFQDTLWVDGLLHHFADYYFDALTAYEQQGTNPPVVWQHAHEVACHEQAHVLQHLFLGINAHINYDLILALADMLQPEWQALSAERRRLRYDDHCRVNEIIADTVDEVQDSVVERYVPALDLVDKVCGPLDEWLASRMIARWRDSVWEQAVQMVEAEDDMLRESVRQQAEVASMRRAHWLLQTI